MKVKMICPLLLLCTWLFASETESECMAKKQNPAFWRQSIRDCTRLDARLDLAAHAQEIAQALIHQPGMEWLTPANMISGSVTYALELERADKVHTIFGGCKQLGAYKHEFVYAVISHSRKRRAYMGKGVVFMSEEGTIECISSQQSAEVNTLVEIAKLEKPPIDLDDMLPLPPPLEE